MQNKTKELWNKLAGFWDESYQEGDIFHRTFLFPTFIKWTGATKGIRILDIGCGNGALARLFSKEGASVTATDFSEVFIEKAAQHSQGLAIDYQVIDATDTVQLNSLADVKFDRIICSMVLHNMPTITPLMTSLSKLLTQDGKFIFSVPHPCFNSGLVELEQLKQQMNQNQLLLPNRYIQPETFEIYSKADQPVKQICFHRPLSVIFNELFDVGFVMSRFIEPVAKKGDLPEDFLWAKLLEIPPAVISCWELKR